MVSRSAAADRIAQRYFPPFPIREAALLFAAHDRAILSETRQEFATSIAIL